ncbi:single-strand selective monofunctional uracil DNA glycosylase-like isoform X2 [Rhodnius prolixus]
MNPGPWGMMQNGVPFGETNSVRDFLDLFGTVHKPDREHPSKPVLGFSCSRSEISGRRFWELARVLGAGSPHQFFKHAFVHNYFPLCLLSSNGKNITPSELKANVKKEIERACDECLVEVLLLLEIEVVVAIGRFVEKRVQKLCSRANLPIQVVFISHPSPRNPSSNRDWLNKTKNLIIDSDLAKYFAV